MRRKLGRIRNKCQFYRNISYFEHVGVFTRIWLLTFNQGNNSSPDNHGYLETPLPVTSLPTNESNVPVTFDRFDRWGDSNTCSAGMQRRLKRS